MEIPSPNLPDYPGGPGQVLRGLLLKHPGRWVLCPRHFRYWLQQRLALPPGNFFVFSQRLPRNLWHIPSLPRTTWDDKSYMNSIGTRPSFSFSLCHPQESPGQNIWGRGEGSPDLLCHGLKDVRLYPAEALRNAHDSRFSATNDPQAQDSLWGPSMVTMSPERCMPGTMASVCAEGGGGLWECFLCRC